jgi:hypothetical protein
MREFLNGLGDMLFRNVLDPLFSHWPVSSSIGAGLIILVCGWLKWRSYQVGYKRISVEIHYHFKSRSEIYFESLSTIKVLRKNIKEYATAIHGGREKPHVECRDPNMHVVLDENPSGGIRKMTVFFDSDVSEGEKEIPLIGDYVDGSMNHISRMPFKLNTRLKQLVIAVRLPETEQIRKASAEIHKSDGMELITSKRLFIWKNNLFVHVFHNVKPKRTYALTWEYENSVEASNNKVVT